MSRKFLKKVVTIKLGAFLPEKILLLVSDTMIRYIDRPVSNKLCAKVDAFCLFDFTTQSFTTKFSNPKFKYPF